MWGESRSLEVANFEKRLQNEVESEMMTNLESYPPVFRQENNVHVQTQIDDDDDDDREEFSKDVQDSDYDDGDDVIPVIDLKCMNWVDELEEACRGWGVLRLVNHEIPLELVNQLQEQAKKIFSLSFESKQTLFNNPVSYFWGTPALTPSGDALKGGPQNINWVEGFNVPLSQLSQFQPEDPMLDSFRLLLEEYGRHMGRVATTLFKGMVKNLNLDKEENKSNLSEDTGLLRVYRYPSLSKAKSAMGMEVHTDSSVLSILCTDKVGGLELLKDDKWFHAKPIPGTLVVNLGDMMQAISNDEYKSVKHRVKVNTREERFSICYFVFPGEGSVIRSSNYKPFTYSDFQAQVQRDIKTVGHKVGLERFRIGEGGN